MIQQSDAQRKKSQRERTARHRAKLKKESANNLAADEERRRSEFDLWRLRERLVSPGECEAFRDAETCPDALTVAREFLIALNQPDVQFDETLFDVERRVVAAWCSAGAPLLNRNTIRFDTSTASTTDGYSFDFDNKWIALPGSNEPINIESLPAIAVPEVVKVPAAEIPAPATTQDPALKKYPSEEVAALCKITQAAVDAEARRISAKNLERELAREKRLGIAYVPASEL
jgi:hypothetical protein